jgi:hypothetical protein
MSGQLRRSAAAAALRNPQAHASVRLSSQRRGPGGAYSAGYPSNIRSCCFTGLRVPYLGCESLTSVARLLPRLQVPYLGCESLTSGRL